jgi:hypothetical protein
MGTRKSAAADTAIGMTMSAVAMFEINWGIWFTGPRLADRARTLVDRLEGDVPNALAMG